MSGGGGGGSSFDEWRSPAGGGSGGGGAGGGGGVDKCAIVERTILNSPVQSVVGALTVGTNLLVELETNPRKRVVVKTMQGAIAGAITSARLVDIIECLQGGYSYGAVVLSINGGRIEVEIMPI